MCNIKNPFLRLLVYGLGAAVAGIVGGFLLGLGIWGLQLIVCSIDGNGNCYGLLNAATFMGSGLGAVIGAIFGGIVALKKK
jgi:hypothetical protein